MEVECWTDGACDMKGNGGWAFILRIPGNPFGYLEMSGGVEKTTSQRMELFAFASALQYISLQPAWAAEIAVHTDSSYLKNCFTQGWHNKWRANGWLNSRGEPVSNKDLWEQLLQLMEINVVRWVKVKGHRGIKLNERCDALAVAQRIAVRDT